MITAFFMRLRLEQSLGGGNGQLSFRSASSRQNGSSYFFDEDKLPSDFLNLNDRGGAANLNDGGVG